MEWIADKLLTAGIVIVLLAVCAAVVYVIRSRSGFKEPKWRGDD